VTLRNVGPRASRELVQVYASRPDSVLERPARWLVAFGHVAADPGAQVSTRLRVPARALEHWDADASGWRCEPGRVVLRAGSSADLLPLEGAVTIAPSGAEAGASLGSAA
jgi:beta-glucosidase